MGEGDQSLEEMLDIFPEGQDDARSATNRRFISGVDESACTSLADHESQQHFVMHSSLTDLDQMLGGSDQDGDEFGDLAGNNSGASWIAGQESPETSSRAPPLATPWDDMPATRGSCTMRNVSADGSSHHHTLRSENSDRSPAHVILAVGNNTEARHLGEEQADDTEATRKSNRKRSATSRFDPVKDGANPRRGGHKRVKLKESSVISVGSEAIPSVTPVSERNRKGAVLHKRKMPSSQKPQARMEISSRAVSEEGQSCHPKTRQQDLVFKRGKHVARKPEMQKTARAGQKRWKELLVKMRADLRESATSAAFAKQLTECKRQKFKSQKEALLLFLQASSRDGLIRPGKFCDPKDAGKGFIGWTSFTVVSGTAEQFHDGVEDLFGEGRSF